MGFASTLWWGQSRCGRQGGASVRGWRLRVRLKGQAIAVRQPNQFPRRDARGAAPWLREARGECRPWRPAGPQRAGTLTACANSNFLTTAGEMLTTAFCSASPASACELDICFTDRGVVAFDMAERRSLVLLGRWPGARLCS